ncbi:hypothetical protein J27TS7_57750 [Paenibacillus dendritiformis]|uniref:hypothetical protein n=1 Tax=Paenibacillus dendritiformis TaxID=130049 RepID=UPI001B11C6F0|nr:hypothetical protein [Paenibacillus dendritiformis]GIO76261.1 hypothetical protein J27TS7_57750 [Paenibacillus dendritiformis]
MNWTSATTHELCAAILDMTATEEEFEAVGAELFRRIGGDRNEKAMQCKALPGASNDDMGTRTNM